MPLLKGRRYNDEKPQAQTAGLSYSFCVLISE